MREITKEEFVDNEGVRLVEFFATWCGPCKMYKPVLERLDARRDDLEVVQIDIDKESELKIAMGIQSVPTVIVFKDGDEVGRILGAQSTKRLDAELESMLN